MKWLAFLLSLVLMGCIVPKPTVKPNELSLTAQNDFVAQINTRRASSVTCNGTGGIAGYTNPQTFTNTGAVQLETRLSAAALNNASFLAVNGTDIDAMDPHNGAGNGSFSSRVSATGFQWVSAGEAVASGQVDMTAAILDWQNSNRGHCHIMMDPEFTRVGVALVTSEGGKTYWVLVAAKPQ
jgi:uncharacterized protein YkwD